MSDHQPLGHQPPSHQHRPVNTAYLVLGLVLLGVAGSWLLRETGALDADGLQWMLPLVLVVAGGAGLLTSLAKGFSRRAHRPVRDEDAPFLEG